MRKKYPTDLARLREITPNGLHAKMPDGTKINTQEKTARYPLFVKISRGLMGKKRRRLCKHLKARQKTGCKQAYLAGASYLFSETPSGNQPRGEGQGGFDAGTHNLVKNTGGLRN